MKYRIVRTDKAEEQLRDIIFYIAADSGSEELALNYLDKLESAIMNLSEFPAMGSQPGYTILKRQGYRVVLAGRHLVFYKIDEAEKTVVIYAIVDKKREYVNLI
ncbi:type II toxin-antitoxin system RelE/ParE family toxin [bacterium 210820-DFI.6.37]|nr:type II toxin-antitoxin system RelE/ParE family toxin [bacterium 210820-DFI.6.37]